MIFKLVNICNECTRLELWQVILSHVTVLILCAISFTALNIPKVALRSPGSQISSHSSGVGIATVTWEAVPPPPLATIRRDWRRGLVVGREGMVENAPTTLRSAASARNENKERCMLYWRVYTLCLLSYRGWVVSVDGYMILLEVLYVLISRENYTMVFFPCWSHPLWNIMSDVQKVSHHFCIQKIWA